MRQKVLGSAALAIASFAIALLPNSADANIHRGGPCVGCGSAPYGSCGSPCQGYQIVEQTVYVPQMVTERRTVDVTVCRPETRQRTITVYRQVPETREVTHDVTVMVPEQRSRTVHYTVHKPVWREVEQQYTVLVPEQVRQSGVHRVCRPVQVQGTRTVCRDMGHWEDRPCVAGGGCGAYGCGAYGHCGSCGSCGPYVGGCGVQRVWVPNVVTEQVPVTVWRTQVVEEPYERTVTVCRPQTRSRTVRVVQYVPEQQSRELTYTVCVPTRQTRSYNVTTYKSVPEERTIDETVMVPSVEQREVNVQVCRMVPRQVSCRVPVYSGCVPCGGCP